MGGNSESSDLRSGGLDLSDFEFFSAQETARYNVAEPARDEEDKRSPFERDRSRVIHSAAFRRLQGKTQIFEPHTADFMRTRLTHSIEVAQIGRGLARRFGLPGSLVEAACLAHDLGHPPFGHTGEEVLNERMEEHGGFEGNAQTFRILTRIEPKHKDYDGLDLCRASLLAVVKYPFKRNQATKKGKFLYLDDTGDDEMAWLYEGTNEGLLDQPDPRPPRTLPCQLMDWADDIAYSVHDLEDGIASGLLRPSTWTSDQFMTTVFESVKDAPGVWVEEEPPDEDDVRVVLKGLVDDLARWEPEIPLDVIREISRVFINDFVIAGDVVQEGTGSSLFEALLKSCHAEKSRDRYLLFPRRMRPALRGVADNQSDLRRLICDYLASLTEGQVRKLYARFYEPGHAQLGI